MSPVQSTQFRASYQGTPAEYGGFDSVLVLLGGHTDDLTEHTRHVGHVVDHLMEENRGREVVFSAQGWTRDDRKFVNLIFDSRPLADVPTTVISNTAGARYDAQTAIIASRAARQGEN
jgi:hypothetical protein